MHLQRFKLILLTIALPVMLQAQILGQRYTHVDTMQVNTVENTKVWDTEWEHVVIYSDTLDVYLKIGAPDTTSWSSRLFFYLPASFVTSFGPSPSLKKVTAKTLVGTCTLYFVGEKKVRQY